jgi:hypothetical protein
MMKQPLTVAVMLPITLLGAWPAFATQDPAAIEDAADPSTNDASAPADDAESLAKKLSNPVASLISVPFQANMDFGSGLTDDGNRMSLNIQPVVPIGITDDVNVIIRTIMPVVLQTNIRGDNVTDFGLGDVTQSFFLSPRQPGASGIIWGAGPVFLYPTATSKYTGGDKWGAGPTAVVLKQFGPTTVGMLANHIWSVAGSNSRPDVSSTFLQPFVSYTTKGATTYGLNAESTYDWKSKQWSVPINISVSQLTRIGKQPVSFALGGRYYVIRPDFGPDWGVRFVTTLLFPKK